MLTRRLAKMSEGIPNLAGLPWWAYLIPFIILYAIGIWLGTRGTVTVYRNYYDIMIVGLLYIVPLVGIGVMALFDYETEAGADIAFGLLVITGLLEAVIFCFVLVRTWFDNPNPFKLLMALYVKLPTGIFFFSHLYNTFTAKKRQERRHSAFWFIFMMPLLYALVKDKSKSSPFGRMPRVR